MKTIAKFSTLLLLGLFSLQATAERVSLYYADGSVAEREVQTSGPVHDAMIMDFALQHRGAQQVTMDVSVAMYSTMTFQEIFFAVPGQTINVSTRFNGLDTLEVPFEQLIGRTLITLVTSPQLGYSQLITFPLEAGDGGIIGVGGSYMIPVANPTGPFLIFGLTRISGLDVVNDRGTNVRRLIPRPLPTR